MEIIQKLIVRKGPGHLFQLAHFFLALSAIEEKGPIGRYELGRILDLGEGSIKTLIHRMKTAGLIIKKENKGHILTEEGIKTLSIIKATLISLQNLEPAEKLTDQKFNLGCQARNVSGKIGSGINLRDLAISVGAKSITSLLYTGRGFSIPTLGSEYLEKEYPQLAQYLLSQFNFQKDDVLIVCGANTLIEAKLGAVTAVLSLINS